ncbi:YrbL family protein [Microbulbifer sp. CnH-101-G]|uniref:YrbL family protein n=1 Tax=Microbulbifer sp. CnH-101-G TaxID=3243393 RepID=UPI0040397210
MDLQLRLDQAIANGNERLVFPHPESDDLLIKVISDRFRKRMDHKYSISTRLRRLTYYWPYMKEVSEHIYLREGQVENTHFVQDFKGFVDTNLGLGITVKAVKKHNGELADTLSALISSKQFNQEHADRLNDLFKWLERTFIVVRDLRTVNIVWDEINGHFVIIDGIGSRRLPSLRSVSRLYNQRANRRRITKLCQRLKNDLESFGYNLNLNFSQTLHY